MRNLLSIIRLPYVYPIARVHANVDAFPLLEHVVLMYRDECGVDPWKQRCSVTHSPVNASPRFLGPLLSRGTVYAHLLPRLRAGWYDTASYVRSCAFTSLQSLFSFSRNGDALVCCPLETTKWDDLLSTALLLPRCSVTCLHLMSIIRQRWPFKVNL